MTDICPDITEFLRSERNDGNVRGQKTLHSVFNVGQGNGAHFALILCHDDIGLQPLQYFSLQTVDAQPLLHNLTDPGIDIATRPTGIEFGFG